MHLGGTGISLISPLPLRALAGGSQLPCKAMEALM